jgi:2-methylcitrate dehydratase
MSQHVPQTRQIAHFALQASFSALDDEITDQLKKHLLDSVASLVFSLNQPTIQKVVRQIKSLSETGSCTVPVIGKTAADRAAQFYTALIRYPDFMDNFLAKQATCHPSDNIGALLAASQLTGATGKDFISAMAAAYEIECRLAEEAPVMIKGFDHTVLLAYSLTAALCRIFSLPEEQAAHALSIAGCAFNPLVTSRASYTYEWKGLASSLVALGCMNTVLLAKEGITGPIQIFEGAKGFGEVFDIDLKYHWEKDNFKLIKKCILKKYNSEVHTQSLIEAVLDLKKNNDIPLQDIDVIDIKTFLTGYHIVGGGDYGNRKEVYSKEQADHSLPYVIAVALLDGQVYPEQLTPERINQPDVQSLLKKVNVHTATLLHRPIKIAGLLDPYTESYPGNVLGRVTIRFKNGKEITIEKEDYHGFFTRPLTWADVEEKFKKLTRNIIDHVQRQKIIEVISSLEDRKMQDLTDVLNSLQPIAINSESL